MIHIYWRMPFDSLSLDLSGDNTAEDCHDGCVDDDHVGDATDDAEVGRHFASHGWRHRRKHGKHRPWKFRRCPRAGRKQTQRERSKILLTR